MSRGWGPSLRYPLWCRPSRGDRRRSGYIRTDATIFQPLFDQCSARGVRQGVEDTRVPAVVACPPDIRVEAPPIHPLPEPCRALGDGIMAAAPRTKPVAVGFKTCLPAWFECMLHACLCDAVRDGRNTQRPLCSIGLWNVETLDRFHLPARVSLPLLDPCHACFRGECALTLYARGLLPVMLLRDSSYRQAQVGVTASPQFRQAPPLIPLTVLGCPIHPWSQVLDPVLDEVPIHGDPVLQRSLRSDVHGDSLVHAGWVP